MQFVLEPRDRFGQALTDRQVTWTASAPTVVTISAAGVATAMGEGTATITASSEGRSASALVRVVPAAPEPAYHLMHSGWPDVPKGEWRLYEATLDGGASRPLLASDVLPVHGTTQAAASPDGARIAFTAFDPDAATSSIYVINPDGTGLQRLTSGGRESQPTWSPDGRRIACVVGPPGGEGDIREMNVDGTDQRNVTGGVNALHQYSPAETRIAGLGERIAFGEGDSKQSALWTMRPDGSDRRRVTEGGVLGR